MQTTTTPAKTPQSTSTPNKPPETQQKIQSSWYERGFSCELWIDPPEQVRRDFRHDVDELVLLVDGLAQIELGGKVVKMQPGDEMTIPAGIRHTVRNCGAGPARWLHGFPIAAQREATAAQ
ncbi:MAG: cupin domain-containing protein [Planctomycetota bacterium]|nr:cupin domain-containing protein [Planctomycetota bacterium]MEC9048218.1 cupin domain-containing protein [Planctomycetota bacterium]